MTYTKITERNIVKYDEGLGKKIAKYAVIGLIGYYFLKGCVGCSAVEKPNFDYKTIDNIVEAKWQK